MAFPRCLEGNCNGRRHPLGQHLSPRSGSAPPALTPEDRDRVQQVIDQTNEMNQHPANNHDAPSSGGGSSGGSSSSHSGGGSSPLPTYTPTQQQQVAIDAFEGDPAMQEAMRNEFRWRAQQEAAPVLTTTPLNLDLTVPAGGVSPSGQVSPASRPQPSIAGAGAAAATTDAVSLPAAEPASVPRRPRRRRRLNLPDSDSEEIPNTGGPLPAVLADGVAARVTTDLDTGPHPATLLEPVDEVKVVKTQRRRAGAKIIEGRNLDVQINAKAQVAPAPGAAGSEHKIDHGQDVVEISADLGPELVGATAPGLPALGAILGDKTGAYTPEQKAAAARLMGQAAGKRSAAVRQAKRAAAPPRPVAPDLGERDRKPRVAGPPEFFDAPHLPGRKRSRPPRPKSLGGRNPIKTPRLARR